MPRPKLTYKGVISENEQIQLELDIQKYLGMSLIPKQRGNDESNFYVTVSSAGKADSNLYHATLALEKRPFVGELYFPMESGASYRQVIYDSLKGVDDLFKRQDMVTIRKDGSTKVDLNRSASECWKIATDGPLRYDTLLGFIESYRRNIIGRLITHSCASKLKLSKELTFERYKKRRKDDESDIEAAIYLASNNGEKALRDDYESMIGLLNVAVANCSLANDHEKAAKRALQNLENYGFYLTGTC